MRKLFAGLALAVSLSILVLIAAVSTSFGAELEPNAPGDKAIVGNFCVKEKDTRILAQAMRDYGDEGYFTVIQSGQLSCFDYRLHQADAWPLHITITERIFIERHKTGVYLEFWRMKDSRNNVGYVWAVHVPPKAPKESE